MTSSAIKMISSVPMRELSGNAFKRRPILRKEKNKKGAFSRKWAIREWCQP